MFCIKCGTKVNEKNKFCINCGCPQDSSVSEQEVPHAKETTGSISAEKLASFVGGNTEYFKAQFSNIEKGGKGNFNWAAFFFNINYCLYRKQYNLIKKYLLLPLVLFVCIYVLIFFFLNTLSLNGLLVSGILSLANTVFAIVMVILLGKKFNELYYNEMLNKKHYIGTSIRNVVIYLVVSMLLGVCVSLFVSYSIASNLVSTDVDSYLTDEDIAELNSNYYEEELAEDVSNNVQKENSPVPVPTTTKREIPLRELTTADRNNLENIAAFASCFCIGELSTPEEKLESVIFSLALSYDPPEYDLYNWPDDDNLYFLATVVDELYYKYFGHLPTPMVTDSFGYYYDYEYESDVYYTCDTGLGFEYSTIINKFVDNEDGTYEMTVHEISSDNERIGGFVVNLTKNNRDSENPYKIVKIRTLR